jgi:hypothetical protein
MIPTTASSYRTVLVDYEYRTVLVLYQVPTVSSVYGLYFMSARVASFGPIFFIMVLFTVTLVLLFLVTAAR